VDKTMEANDRQGLVHVTAGLVMLEGALDIPAGAHGIVLFTHGSGSKPVQSTQSRGCPDAPLNRPGNAADRPAHAR